MSTKTISNEQHYDFSLEGCYTFAENDSFTLNVEAFNSMATPFGGQTTPPFGEDEYAAYLELNVREATPTENQYQHLPHAATLSCMYASDENELLSSYTMYATLEEDSTEGTADARYNQAMKVIE